MDVGGAKPLMFSYHLVSLEISTVYELHSSFIRNVSIRNMRLKLGKN